MAISGVVNGTTSNENIDVRLRWTASIDESQGKVKLDLSLCYQRNNSGFQTTGTGNFRIHVANASETFGNLTASKRVIITETAETVAVSGTIYVPLTQTWVYINGYGSIPDTTLTSTTLNTTVGYGRIYTPDLVSRSVDSSYITGTITMKYKTASAHLYHRATVSLVGGTTIKTVNLGQKAKDTTHTVTITLSESEQANLVSLMDGSTSAPLSIAIYSYPKSDYSSYASGVTYNLTLSIPPAATIDALSGGTSYFTGELTYKYTPSVAVFYNRCNIALNINGEYTAVKTINLGKKAASQQTATVTLSASELSTIYNKLPNSKSGKLRFTLRTYSDSGYTSQVGDAGYKEITLTIPNDTTTQPTMTMTLAPVTDFTTSSAIYVKSKSKVKATFASGAGKYGATIASYKLTVAGKEYASPYTSEYIASAGSVTVKGTITDSRGFSRTYTQNITVLDYIAPTFDSLACNTSYFNGTLTYKYTPPNDTFYSRCKVAIGGTQFKTITHDRASGQQTATVVFSESELSTIYNKYPNGTSGILKFTFEAATDSSFNNLIGSGSRELTLSIPNIEATQPTATLTIAPESSLASPFNTLYIKGKTKVKATLASGAGKYGATIKSYRVTIGALSGNSPLTSDFLTTLGDVIITGVVTDSRGFTKTYTNTITVIDHSAPRIIPISGKSEVIAARCNAEGALDVNGTYLLIAAKRSYSKVEVSGVQKNFCKIQYRYKVDGGSYSSWVDILARTAADDEVLTGALLAGALVTTSTYVVQIRVIDDIGDTGTTTIFVPTEKVYMHKAGSINAIGIGKYAEEVNTVDIGEDMTTIFRGDVQFKSEEWVSRALGTGVVASTVNSGRWGGSGVFYRVCAGGKHIYVAFNVSFTTKTSTVRADSETIPAAYRPSYDVYALCPVGFSDGSRGIATVSVSPSGRVNIYAVHKLPGAVLSSGETVSWIDGYIDFWT